MNRRVPVFFIKFPPELQFFDLFDDKAEKPSVVARDNYLVIITSMNRFLV
jgi:hypothetical protein